VSRGYIEGDGSESPFMYLQQSIYERALKSKRGRKLLRDLANALDAMPVKRLVPNSFEAPTGEVCSLGAVGRARGLDMTPLEAIASEISNSVNDYEAGESICLLNEEAAAAFDAARTLVAEIMFTNDDGPLHETPEQRFVRMRMWVAGHLEVKP
jgi:hypothetical protein